MVHHCSRFFDQDNFLGIRFAELGFPLNHKTRANGPFWDHLYAEVIHRFPSIDDLPSRWVREKREVAALLGSLLSSDRAGKVYSFGGGLGVVEQFLVEETSSELVLADFSELAGYYSERVALSKHGDLKTVGSQFSSIIGVQVLYALDRNQIERVLREFHDLLLPGGLVILVNSVTLCELEQEPASKAAMVLFSRIVSMPRNLLRSARLRFSRRQGLRQGWGWERCQQTYDAYLIDAGFVGLRHIEHPGGTFVIAKKEFADPH